MHRELNPHRLVRPGEGVFVGVTAARLLLIVPLIWGIAHSAPMAVFALLAIVAMDVLDGVLARGAGLDGPMRRIVDAGVDRLLIHTASLAVVLADPSLWLLYAPLAARDLLLAGGDLWCIGKRRTHIAGRSLHRASSASFALLGLAVLTLGQSAALLAAALAWVVNYALLLDYLPTLRNVVAGPPSADIAVTTTDSAERNNQTRAILGTDTP